MIEDLTELTISPERMAAMTTVEELSVELAVRGRLDCLERGAAMTFLLRWLFASTYIDENRTELESAVNAARALLENGFSDDDCRKFFLDKNLYSDIIKKIRMRIEQWESRNRLNEMPAMFNFDYDDHVFQKQCGILVDVTDKIMSMDENFISDLRTESGKNVACVVADLFGLTFLYNELKKIRSSVSPDPMILDSMFYNTPLKSLFTMYRKCGCEVYQGMFSENFYNSVLYW